MGGPAYYRSHPSKPIQSGYWYEGEATVLPADRNFEIRLPPQAGGGTPPGSSGIRFMESPGRSSTNWFPLTRFSSGDPSREPSRQLVDPDTDPLLDVWESARGAGELFLDARRVPRDQLGFLHTLPVSGWLQGVSEPPPCYRPERPGWARSGADPVFCFVHGFTGDPVHWQPTVEFLSTGPWGYCVPQLPGHGLAPEDFARFGQIDWETGLERCLKWLGRDRDSIVGVGLSMGGSLVLQQSEFFDAVVAVNTPINLPSWERFFLPLLQLFQTHHEPSDSDKIVPLSSYRELGSLLRKSRQHLEAIRCPALVINHREDETVPLSHGRAIAAQIPDAERVIFDEGGHESPREPVLAEALLLRIFQWLDSKDLYDEDLSPHLDRSEGDVSNSTPESTAHPP